MTGPNSKAEQFGTQRHYRRPHREIDNQTEWDRRDAMRQSIDNLHDDITKVVVESQQAGFYGRVLEVIDPSPGLWGGEPLEGLVTIVYECSMPIERMHGGADHPAAAPGKHCHHALFGPVDEKDRKEGETVDHYSLYAD